MQDDVSITNKQFLKEIHDHIYGVGLITDEVSAQAAQGFAFVTNVIFYSDYPNAYQSQSLVIVKETGVTFRIDKDKSELPDVLVKQVHIREIGKNKNQIIIEAQDGRLHGYETGGFKIID